MIRIEDLNDRERRLAGCREQILRNVKGEAGAEPADMQRQFATGRCTKALNEMRSLANRTRPS